MEVRNARALRIYQGVFGAQYRYLPCAAVLCERRNGGAVACGLMHS